MPSRVEARSLSATAKVAMALSAISLWCLTEQSCVPDPDFKPTTAYAEEGVASWIPEAAVDEGVVSSRLLDGRTEPLPGVTVRSLKQAANLLNQAAEVVDTNEGLAVQFIRQAIAILKHDVIRSLSMPDADHVTTTPWNSFSNPHILKQGPEVAPRKKGSL